MRSPAAAGAASRGSTPPRSLSAALAGIAIAAALVGCGSDESGTIPQSDANALLERLDKVNNELEALDCDQAKIEASTFQDEVNDLPDEVDPDVKGALTSGAGNLVKLVQEPSGCEPPPTTDIQTEVPTTVPDTSVTTTTDTTTTDTETETDTTEAPPEQPSGEGQANPPSNGGSGEGGSGGPGSGGTGEGGE